MEDGNHGLLPFAPMAVTRNVIRFLLAGQPQEVAGIDPTMTVLDWLRLEKMLHGTKEGCAEGDCGACTVVVGRRDGSAIRYEAINACIRFMPTLDGCHLLTVEHLRRPDGSLHPVQQAMVDCHGSQCGFCTPGFVMSLFALYLNEARPSDDRVRDALAGNLCRCTGYAPIIAAARRMYALGVRATDDLVVTAEDLSRRLGLPEESETLLLEKDGRRFIAPATSDGLAEALIEHPQATLVSGATDAGLWVTKALRQFDATLYLGRIAELRTIAETAVALEIGGGVTFSAAEPALTRLYPDFGELLRRIGGVQVRNAGTLGGNIGNGSPIGDSPPALIAVGATLTLRLGDARRTMPIEDYFIAYGKQDRRPGEFIETITVPKPTHGAEFRAYKISKRFDQDISALCGAFLVELADGVVSRIRIAFGGMAGTPKRAAGAEAALLGKEWTLANVTAAMAVLRGDFTPLSDWRASADYRLTVAANLLMKFFLETGGASADLRLVGRGRVAHA
jgi:xanthine dehydrogenase small subunit